jgi:AAA domain
MADLTLNDAQALVLSAALANGCTIFGVIHPDDLDSPYREWAYAMETVRQATGRLDLPDFALECNRVGVSPDYMRWWHGSVSDDEAIEAFTVASARERLVQALTRAKQRHDIGSDPGLIVDELRESLDALPILGERRTHLDGWTVDDILRFHVDDDDDMVLPGLLAHRERLVITGNEGGGKSMFMYQCAMAAAYGISPLRDVKSGEFVHHRPKRVMVLDVENRHETQVRRHVAMLSAAMRRLAPGVKPDLLLLKARSLNLMSAADQRYLWEQAQMFKPDLLLAGSVYKLIVSTGDWRAEAAAVRSTMDRVKDSTGCAVMLEAHPGHGPENKRNDGRPQGSSEWLAWPEFGFYLKPVETQNGSWLAELAPWRGVRVQGRQYPEFLEGGGDLPWSRAEAAAVAYATGGIRAV